MKYLKMFEAVVGLFPRTIRVKLVDMATGQLIGTYKIAAEQLPSAFNRPTTLEINQINWRVMKADPVSANDFLFSKKLKLFVYEDSKIDKKKLYYDLPTICRPSPETCIESLYNDFTLELSSLEWQQQEFKHLDQTIAIDHEIEQINQILSEQPNALLGFQRQYIRNASLFSLLSIPFHEFCETVKKIGIGNVFLDNNGFVKNGFALRSDSNTYYGIVDNEVIQTLCVTAFNYVDDEFMQIVTRYKLLLIDWCNARILSMAPFEEMGDKAVQWE